MVFPEIRGKCVIIFRLLFYILDFLEGMMTTDEERLTVVNVVASTRVAEELDLPILRFN